MLCYKSTLFLGAPSLLWLNKYMPQKPSQASQAYSDSHAYIPPHVQEAMAKQVEHMSPSHMKQYAGAFVQQNMTQGRAAPQAGKVSGPPAGYRPVTHLPRKDHFHQYKAQQPSRADTFLPGNQAPEAQLQPDMMPQAAEPAPIPPTPEAPTYFEQTPGPRPNTMPDYDFIMNNQQPAAKRSLVPGSNSSLPIRIGLVVGGLVVLLIVFNIAKGLLAGPSNLPYYMSVIQDQQEIGHLSTNALKETDLSTIHKNFAAVKSSQSDLVKLLVANNKKVDEKKANLKVSATADTQLTSAAASGTYNSTFNEIMQEQLKTYKSDLNATYAKTTSTQSRKLLKSQYDQAELLSQQLSAGSTVSTN
jgi:hypothetical protein